jgi:hypothetical protein
MLQTKALSLRKEITLTISKFILILGLAIFAPLIGMQSVTGIMVNALLFIGTVILGIRGAMLIAIVPSVVSLSIGFFPIALAPIVPFIIMGNILLISTFNWIYKRNFWGGIITASAVKFVFIYGMSLLIVNFVIKSEIAQKIAAIMGWPQLLTALAGGVVAYLFLKSIKRI